MNFRFTVVETSLNRAEFRWKWLRFLQHSFTLGVILCLLVLGFAGAVALGWATSKSLATAFFALLAVAGFIAWVVIIICVAAGSPDRGWLAAALERVEPRLLDRLNTLLFLEGRRADARSKSFAARIAKQTQRLFAEKAPPSAFPARRPVWHLLAFLVALVATGLVYQTYSPWQKLLLAEKAKAVEPVQPEKPLELTLPATNNVEQNQNWGEVRITDPGSDLKVTKVDVVPLEIEAAANQALQKVNWSSTVNGAEEKVHELPPPKEPRYAVYQPTLYLDELQLSDWDVMTYYAKATAQTSAARPSSAAATRETGKSNDNAGSARQPGAAVAGDGHTPPNGRALEEEKENGFASEVYFLEVRPFREDILKLPGGEGGKCYSLLSEMTALIGRQQHIIRQTHQHLQKPLEQENLQEQDRRKLAEAEADLGDSAEHLYAKMANEMENKPIGEALDSLAKAGKSLDRTSKLLEDNVMNDAQKGERSALTDLVAARKIFQKAISEHPKDFEEKEEESTPAANPSRKLSEMAEFRNEARAARDFVQKTLEQQKALERTAHRTPPNNYPKLGEQEKQLEKALQDFQALHPQVFKRAEAESEQAREAMAKAAESLEKRSNDARTATQQASQQLEQLNEAMRSRSAEQQLAHAYKLKEMLDQQIQTLGQCSNPGNNVSPAEVQKTAGDARETVNQLRKVAEQEPTRDAFGQPLRDALSGTNRLELDTRLNQLEQAQDDAERQQRAGEAKAALSKVSQAFNASEPKALQMAQKSDSLKPGEQDSFNLGMAELESLLKQLEKAASPESLRGQIPRDDQAKQGREALFNLETGMRALYGGNERGQKILMELDQMFKTNSPLDTEDLRKLMDALRHFSVETADHLAKKEDKPEVTNIDPTRLPPAYRGRIQKYFQKLSEK